MAIKFSYFGCAHYTCHAGPICLKDIFMSIYTLRLEVCFGGWVNLLILNTINLHETYLKKRFKRHVSSYHCCHMMPFWDHRNQIDNRSIMEIVEEWMLTYDHAFVLSVELNDWLTGSCILYHWVRSWFRLWLRDGLSLFWMKWVLSLQWVLLLTIFDD